MILVVLVVLAFTFIALYVAAVIGCLVIAPLHAGYAKCRACRSRPCRCGNGLHP